MSPIPDSEIARQAEAYLRATSGPSLVNHCLRSYLWGVALADVEKVTYDAELLFVSAALHDLGLVPALDTGAPFENDSGTAAHRFAQKQGWGTVRAGSAESAIVLHMAPDVTLDQGAETYLLWHATAADVAGRRLDELPAATVSQVTSAYPWLDFTDHLGGLFADQVRHKPTSRAGQLVDAGLLDWLAACPLGWTSTKQPDQRG